MKDNPVIGSLNLKASKRHTAIDSLLFVLVIKDLIHSLSKYIQAIATVLTSIPISKHPNKIDFFSFLILLSVSEGGICLIGKNK